MVELQIVILAVAGSNPVGRPFSLLRRIASVTVGSTLVSREAFSSAIFRVKPTVLTLIFRRFLWLRDTYAAAEFPGCATVRRG